MSKGIVHKRSGWIALILFAVAATALLRHSLLPDYALLPLDLVNNNEPWALSEPIVPQNALISDPFYSFYPRRYLLTESIQQGELPLWNPFVMAGTPNFANPNFQLFYWPNLITAVFLPAVHALSWLAWGHLILSGMLMYLFLRRQQLIVPACWLGGMVWLLNGYTLVWLENPHRLSTAAWIPGIFWAYETAVQTKRYRWAAIGGLILGTAILGGQVQFIFATGLVFGLYGLIGALSRWQKEDWASAKQSVLMMLPIGLIGLGIGSLVLLPSTEFAQISQRSLADATTILDSRWPTSQLITLLAPDFFGNPQTIGYWGTSNYAEMTAYFGAGALALAISGVLVGGYGRFYIQAVAIASFSLLLVIGSPLINTLFIFPGAEFLSLRRLLFLIPFAGALLVAIGLDGWWHKPSSNRQLAALGVVGTSLALLVIRAIPTLENVPQANSSWQNLGRGLLLATVMLGLMVYLPKRPFLIAGLALLIVMLDLLQWGWRFNPITSTELLYPDNEITNFLAQDQSVYRTLPLQKGSVLFGPNVLSLYGQQSLGGYTPLIPEGYAALYQSVDDDVQIEWMASNRNMLVMSHFNPLVSLLNVKYVLSTEPLPYDIIPQEGVTGCDDQLIVSQEPITMPFVIADPGFNRFDLQFGEDVSQEAGDIVVSVWRDEFGGSLLFQDVVPSSELSQNQGRAFFMAPVADSAGQTYVLSLQTEQGEVPICAVVGANGGRQPSLLAFATWLNYRMDDGDVWVYENPNVMPRAFMVHHVEQTTAEQALTRLSEPDFNWSHSALLSEPLPQAEAEQLAKRPFLSEAQVTVTHYAAHQVDIQVNTPTAGLLVLNDTYYPSWRATLNEQDVEIHKVNNSFRGIFVPVGEHQIQFSFQSQTLTVALIISAISLLLATGIIIKEKI